MLHNVTKQKPQTDNSSNYEVTKNHQIDWRSISMEHAHVLLSVAWIGCSYSVLLRNLSPFLHKGLFLLDLL